MRQIIDVETWKRKEEFLFFKKFQSPLISVTVEVDCTVAVQKAKDMGIPVSRYYLHAALVAVNRVEEFRYRWEEGQIVLYDRVDLFTPVLSVFESYRSVILPYCENLEDFLKEAGPVMEKAKRGEGRAHGDSETRRDLVLISVNPWYRFTSVQLGVPGNPHSGFPIFTFGKLTFENEKWVMPVALSVNHGFIDGFHIGRFLNEFQQMLDR